MPFTRKVSQALTASQTGLEVSLGPLSRFPAAGELSVYASATRAGLERVDMTVLVGTDIICDRSRVNAQIRAGALEIPNDLIAQGMGNMNDPITIRLDEVGAAAATVEILVSIS